MTPEEFLSSYTAEVRDTALAARRLVLSVMPDVVEYVDTGNSVVKYGTIRKMVGLVFAISAHKAHSDIIMFGGATLSDPAHLLEGTGRRLRHVKLRRPQDVDNPALRVLLLEALAAHQVENGKARGAAQ